MSKTEVDRRSQIATALRAYKQADMDGVMVLVSRQACDEAAALLSEKTAIPEGWKLVPVEPTIEMENGGDKADRDYSNNRFHGLGHMGRVYFVYHHMLAAAPSPDGNEESK